jgi:tetratricopeptide (TPR) repeat protein
MMPKRLPRWIILVALLSAPLILAAQTAQEREAQAASFLVQADDAYAKDDYQKAIEDYFRVVQTSVSKMNLSRAHLGLSLCYFYLNDTVNAKKYILRLLENDPQKEVSPLFHPQTYVDLFNEVKKENEGRLGQGVVSAPAEAAAEAQESPGPNKSSRSSRKGSWKRRGATSKSTSIFQPGASTRPRGPLRAR